MCVIVISEVTRPTEEQITKMWDTNDHGAGIAWRENGAVQWRKGLDLEGIKNLCAEVPMPFVAHFRIASSGGQRADLTHPFPIEKSVPLALTGSTKGNVMFHNGHWTRWQDVMLETTGRGFAKIPVGKWSDSRAMAFLAAIHGIGYLELLDNQKWVVFGPGTCEVSAGWSKINEGFYASNKHWETKAFYPVGQEYNRQHMCKLGTCCKTKEYNKDYCFDHRYMADKQEDIGVGKVIDVPIFEEKKKESGGAPTHVLPFVQACKLLREGKISKNKWKKARKQYEKEKVVLQMASLKAAEAKLGNNVVVGEVVH